jgi:hypothetical protein
MTSAHPDRRPTGALTALAAGFTIAATMLSGAVQARAGTIDVYDDHGGSVASYDRRWAQISRSGANIRIVGPCQSACTVLLRHIPRQRICVTPEASFGFHLARKPEMTAVLRSGYAPDIMGWISRHGGLTHEFIWMSAPDTYHYFRKCP